MSGAIFKTKSLTLVPALCIPHRKAGVREVEGRFGWLKLRGRAGNDHRDAPGFGWGRFYAFRRKLCPGEYRFHTRIHEKQDNRLVLIAPTARWILRKRTDAQSAAVPIKISYSNGSVVSNAKIWNPSQAAVVSRVMRKFVCRLRLNEVSRQ